MHSFLSDDGERLFVAVAGSGPPLIMLHEWAADHSVWQPLVERLSARFKVYYWDARGHGGHPCQGREPPTIQRMGRDLALMIDHFGLGRPAVVGHSMGALTTWEFAQQFGSGGIGRLCIIDQSPRLMTGEGWDLGIYGDFSADHSREFSHHLRRDFAETVLQLIAHGRNLRARRLYEQNSLGFQRLREKLTRLDPVPLITCWESLVVRDYRALQASIRIPVLLIFGAESNYYGTRTGEYLRDLLFDARLRVYEAADHSPYLAQRDRFVADLTAFLDE
ncbi:MAG: alpha/beta hydrolase [Gammaproteobacteria bacterium]|nr:alpha/beta hydrolase [Gammaproteobacteria bacterium]